MKEQKGNELRRERDKKTKRELVWRNRKESENRKRNELRRERDEKT